MRGIRTPSFLGLTHALVSGVGAMPVSQAPVGDTIKTVRIGRKQESDVVLDDPSVSRLHAELTVTSDGQAYLVDCASSGGTFVSREQSWQRLQQDFVQASETVLLGRVEVTVQRLLSLAMASQTGRSARLGSARTSSNRTT